MIILPHENQQTSNNPLPQHNPHYSKSIQIPKTLINSHTNMLGLIPLQQNSQALGSNCFWPILLSYLQIQHYNIQFSKVLSTHKPTQTQTDEKQQQRSEDALSIGSSINIRQRKVSFGIINYRNEQSNKKKAKKPQNIWMILNQNDQNKLNLLKQTQKTITQIIKKIKSLVYQYAYNNDQASRNSQPINSISVAKAFASLFPKQQQKLADIFLYQKNQIHSILEFLSLPNQTHSENMGVLFEALNDVAMNKILTLKKNQASQNQNYQEETKFLSNMKGLMEYFGFEQDKDFKIIKSSDENNPQSSSLLNPFSEHSETKNKNVNELCGFQFQKGFFRVFLTQSGYLTSINIESLQNVIQTVKKHFMKPFNAQNTKQHKQQTPMIQNKNPQGSVLTWQQTHFHKVIPSNFISRYNNRYFKNQRLVYKQKSKLESRFKEQQVEDLIPQENYDCGYQILINSKNGKKEGDSRHCQGQEEIESSQHIIKMDNPLINPTLEHSFSQKRNPESVQIRQNYKEKFLIQNSRPFYVEEQQEIVQSNISASKQDLEKKRISRQEEIERLYKREDFQISDNEILDDIQRVLI